MSASALPVKLVFDPNGDPSAIAEFVINEDHIPSALLQLSGAGANIALSTLQDVSVVNAPNDTDSLVWSVDDNRWIASGVTNSLSSLLDVSTFPDIKDEYLLHWDEGDQLWVASATFASSIEVAALTGATFFTVQDTIDTMHSAGWEAGGQIVSASVNSVDVSAGQGFIRAENNASAILYDFDWAASTISPLTSGEAVFIGVDYNGGSPTIISATDPESYNNKTQFILGH